MVPIEGLDHVVITVADVEATVGWYVRVLGAEPLNLDLWRAGTIPIVRLQLGTSRISVHPAESPASPHAIAPTRGSADLCFRFDGPVDEIVEVLRVAYVPVVEGPVPRTASNGLPGQSVYCHDPDGNLVELLTTFGFSAGEE